MKSGIGNIEEEGNGRNGRNAGFCNCLTAQTSSKFAQQADQWLVILIIMLTIIYSSYHHN